MSELPVITAADVEQTRAALGDRVRTTPVHAWRCDALETALGRDTEVVLKLELLQVTGTFKVRGAFNVLRHLAPEQLAAGLTAVSAGNHAIAAAYTAREMGASVKVAMIRTANPFRVERCRAYGGEVVLVDDAGAGFALVERLVGEEGRTFVHPFEGLHTSLGTATLGLELCRQVEALDAVIVPIGGGGLASGVATAVKLFQPECAVYGVEPVGAPTMTRALAAGEPVTLDAMDTIADSLAAPFTGPVSFGLCRAHLDAVVLVDDEQLRAAQRLALAELKLVLEPAAAAATAALLGPLAERLAGRRVGVIVCGSNIDLATFASQIGTA